LKAARQLRAAGSQAAPHDKFQLYDEQDELGDGQGWTDRR
jgi:hypothetical protein